MIGPLYTQLVEKNHYYIDLANKLYGMNMPYPKIRCDIQGKVGGWAKPYSWEVNYNPHFLENHTSHFLVQTVGHEVAHLVASLKGGRRHCSIWKNVMYKLGLNPDRTHNYEVTSLPKYANNMYIYTCDCCEHPVSSKIHTSILSGRWRKCNRCKARLVFKSAPSQHPSTTTQSTITPIFGGSPSPVYAQQEGNTTKNGGTITPVKKQTNKSVVADIMVRYSYVTKTDAELITIIQNTLNVTRSNASVYLYNHRKK